MPPKGSTASAAGWPAEEEVSLNSQFPIILSVTNIDQLEFITRFMFHLNGMPSLSGFAYKDRTTSSMRNKLHGLVKKFNIDVTETGKGEAKSKAAAPKKAPAPKKGKVTIDDEDEEGNEEPAKPKAAPKKAAAPKKRKNEIDNEAGEQKKKGPGRPKKAPAKKAVKEESEEEEVNGNAEEGQSDDSEEV